MGAANGKLQGKPAPPPVKKLNSVGKIENLIENNEIVVIGFFKDPESTSAKNFLAATNVFHNFTFGITTNETIFNEFDAKDDSVIVFTQFDERKKIFNGEKTEDNFKKFIHIYSLPIISEYNYKTADQIMKSPIKSHVLFFISKKAGHYEKYVETLRNIAELYREKILFVSVDSDGKLKDDEDNNNENIENDEEDALDIFQTFEITKRSIPTVRFVKYSNRMFKYKAHEESKKNFTPAILEDLLHKFRKGQLKRLLMSQELPEDWNKNLVKILVATNFNEIAFDKRKDVFVEFYAPWCGQCKFIMKILEQLGEKYKDNKSIVIAKMNASRNELENLDIPYLPHMKLIRKGDNKVFNYTYRWTFEDFAEFIETGGEWGESANAE